MARGSKGDDALRSASARICLVGRRVGLSFDGPIISGWGAIAHTEEEVTDLMDKLRHDGTRAVL